VLPPPCPLGVQPIDFAHAEELITLALDDAREFLAGGGEERPPIRMRMHRHHRGSLLQAVPDPPRARA
jgi:hypothetical protein